MWELGHFRLKLLNIDLIWADRSLMAKKADGIKESTDSNATIEEDDARGKPLSKFFSLHFWYFSEFLFDILLLWYIVDFAQLSCRILRLISIVEIVFAASCIA